MTNATTSTFALSEPISVTGRIGQGTFHVTTVDDLAQATVTLSARNEKSEILARTVVELNGTSLSIISPRQGGVFEMFGRQLDPIDVAVTVPTGTPVTLVAVSAEITLTGRCGDADIAGGSCDITAGDVDGNLRLRCGRGTVTIGSVRGSAHLRSGAGNATIGRIGGSLHATCGSGVLRADEVHGTVHSRAGSGGAHLGAAYGDVDLASGSGELSIGLPAGVPARLDVNTGSGRVDSELPIADAPTAGAQPISVRARTGSGNVRLFRTVAAA